MAKDIEPDAVSRKFEPYLTAGCVGTITAPLWCGLRVQVIKATAETPGTSQTGDHIERFSVNLLLLKWTVLPPREGQASGASSAAAEPTGTACSPVVTSVPLGGESPGTASAAPCPSTDYKPQNKIFHRPDGSCGGGLPRPQQPPLPRPRSKSAQTSTRRENLDAAGAGGGPWHWRGCGVALCGVSRPPLPPRVRLCRRHCWAEGRGFLDTVCQPAFLGREVAGAVVPAKSTRGLLSAKGRSSEVSLRNLWTVVS